MSSHREISGRKIRRAAVNAGCDEQTAIKVAIGLPVVGAVRERVARELRRLGIDVPVCSRADEIETAPALVGGGS